IIDLKRDARLRSVIVFKNHGAEAGASLEHPHSQLIATPVVPLVVAEEVQQARAYYDYRERCLFCDIVRQQVGRRFRVDAETPEVVAFAPFAARFPFETWLVPRRHAAAFEQTDEPTLHEVATVLRVVLRKLARALEDPPYNLILHSAPFGAGESPSYHSHIEIPPKLHDLGGLPPRDRLPQQSECAGGRCSGPARPPRLMRVAMFAPEVHPYAKTGGLADVLAALPPALTRLGVEVSVCLPAYRSTLRGR